MTVDQYLMAYQRGATIISIEIIIIPTVLLYLNRTKSYALMSVIAQIFTEIAGKFYVIWTTTTNV